MTPDRSHSDTVGRVANKVRVNPYFYVLKYRSSDALPAPDIFRSASGLMLSEFYDELAKIENKISDQSLKDRGIVCEKVL